VISYEIGYKTAAKKFAVPQTTLGRCVKKERENPGGFQRRSGKGTGSIFSDNGTASFRPYHYRITIFSISTYVAK
jgi:hypothetical protein